MKRSFIFKVFSILTALGTLETSASEGGNKIALYGYGGDGQISESYHNEAIDLGEFLSKQHIVPISGCLSGHGNLHKVIESCTQNGGVVEGFVNEASVFPVDVNIHGSKSYIKSYEQLKKQMFVNGKAFIILPSGIGGLGAALDILCLKKIGAHCKPIYFYNEKFWQPILTSLKEMVGALPDYKIINHGSDMINAAQWEDNLNKQMVEEFFDQQYQARHSSSVRGAKSLTQSKLTLEMLDEILEVYLARIEGIHNKVISLGSTNPISEDDSIPFEISPCGPLKKIFDYMYSEGFIKEEHMTMIQFRN